MDLALGSVELDGVFFGFAHDVLVKELQHAALVFGHLLGELLEGIPQLLILLFHILV